MWPWTSPPPTPPTPPDLAQQLSRLQSTLDQILAHQRQFADALAVAGFSLPPLVITPSIQVRPRRYPTLGPPRLRTEQDVQQMTPQRREDLRQQRERDALAAPSKATTDADLVPKGSTLLP